MKKTTFLFILLAAAAVSSCKEEEPQPMPWDDPTKKEKDYKVGKILPDWSEGYLDIHMINSARGECNFIIMPDGTTMLIDAGELYKYKSSSYENVTPKPDYETRPYKVYTSYIQHFLPKGHSRLDYCVVSHYHNDHIGNLSTSFDKHSEGGYYLFGITALYEEVPFSKLIDRSYPDYSKKAIGEATESLVNNYAQFVNYAVKNKGLVAEKCKVGTSSQVPLKYNASKYPNFKVFCYGCDGEAYNGSEVVKFDGVTAENARSNSWLISYGNFEYFTSGDANGTPVSTIANAIGRKIEAMKCHHHMSNEGSFKKEFDVLQPKVVMTQSFYVRPKEQPHPTIIKNYSGSCQMWFTNIDPSIPENDPATYKNVTGMNGHLVLRVNPDLKTFHVYMLDDTNMEYRIKQISAEYTIN